jgi:hypothetical protein
LKRSNLAYHREVFPAFFYGAIEIIEKCRVCEHADRQIEPPALWQRRARLIEHKEQLQALVRFWRTLVDIHAMFSNLFDPFSIVAVLGIVSHTFWACFGVSGLIAVCCGFGEI